MLPEAFSGEPMLAADWFVRHIDLLYSFLAACRTDQC
jgi:hypothetical protein